MLAAEELERGPFSLRDLRRTAETQMAALGISSDVRGQIQSHGLGGIQARHYDRHDYMPEKRAALELWSRPVSGSSACGSGSDTSCETTVDSTPCRQQGAAGDRLGVPPAGAHDRPLWLFLLDLPLELGPQTPRCITHRSGDIPPVRCPSSS
jgi:hypothetical protein